MLFIWIKIIKNGREFSMFATDCRSRVKRQRSINLIIILSLMLSYNFVYSEGKFLRGVEQAKYTLNGKVADFS